MFTCFFRGYHRNPWGDGFLKKWGRNASIDGFVVGDVDVEVGGGIWGWGSEDLSGHGILRET